jgi:hypothetical protein
MNRGRASQGCSGDAEAVHDLEPRTIRSVGFNHVKLKVTDGGQRFAGTYVSVHE